MTNPSIHTLTEDQQEVAARLISDVVRDSMLCNLNDVNGRALTAANAYVAGVLQVNRAASLAAPDRPASK